MAGGSSPFAKGSKAAEKAVMGQAGRHSESAGTSWEVASATPQLAAATSQLVPALCRFPLFCALPGLAPA